MMHTLENDALSVKISSHGAELCSVFSNQYKLEYLWEAKKNVWPRHAPHLFPVVGKLRNNEFKHQEKTFQLNQHGFARDKTFKISGEWPSVVQFDLCDDAETLKSFPFRFRLRITFRLHENLLAITYRVFNPSDENIFFSLGAHPGFSTMGNGLSDFYLEFEKEENTERFFVEDGLIGNTTEAFKTEKRRFALHPSLFDRDALVFRKLNSRWLKFCNKNTARGVQLQWDDAFSYFGVWTKKSCNEFLCLEPWAGIADTTNASGNLKEKEGMICLQPGLETEMKTEYLFF